MSEAPQMNDEAARSPTGEILDQSATPPTPPTTTPPAATADGQTPTPPTPPTPPTNADTKPTTPPAAPDAYTFKAPDNYTIDPKLLETATPIFKELGLSQDQAQKLVDIQIARELALAKAPQDSYAALRTEWQNKVTGDPEISGYSAHGKSGIEAVKVDIGRALGALNNAPLAAEFKSAMDLTGAGDHPAFVKAFWKLSQMIGEGSHVSGANPSPMGQRAPGAAERPSAAQAMYPKLA